MTDKDIRGHLPLVATASLLPRRPGVLTEGERPTLCHLTGLAARRGRIADDVAAAYAPRDLLVGRAGAVLALLGRHRAVDVDDRAFVAGWLARRDDLRRVDLAGPLDADALDAHRLQVHAQPPQLALCVDLATLIGLTDRDRDRGGAMPMLGAHLRLLVSVGVLDDTAASDLRLDRPAACRTAEARGDPGRHGPAGRPAAARRPPAGLVGRPRRRVMTLVRHPAGPGPPRPR